MKKEMMPANLIYAVGFSIEVLSSINDSLTRVSVEQGYEIKLLDPEELVNILELINISRNKSLFSPEKLKVFSGISNILTLVDKLNVEELANTLNVKLLENTQKFIEGWNRECERIDNYTSSTPIEKLLEDWPKLESIEIASGKTLDEFISEYYQYMERLGNFWHPSSQLSTCLVILKQIDIYNTGEDLDDELRRLQSIYNQLEVKIDMSEYYLSMP